MDVRSCFIDHAALLGALVANGTAILRANAVIDKYGRQRRVIGSWKMYKDWALWCCACCCCCCCACCCCCCLNQCFRSHHAEPLVQFQFFETIAPPPRQILGTVTIFRSHYTESFALLQFFDIAAPPPRQIPCACHASRIILKTSVFASDKPVESAISLNL